MGTHKHTRGKQINWILCIGSGRTPKCPCVKSMVIWEVGGFFNMLTYREEVNNKGPHIQKGLSIPRAWLVLFPTLVLM